MTRDMFSLSHERLLNFTAPQSEHENTKNNSRHRPIRLDSIFKRKLFLLAGFGSVMQEWDVPLELASDSGGAATCIG